MQASHQRQPAVQAGLESSRWLLGHSSSYVMQLISNHPQIFSLSSEPHYLTHYLVLYESLDDMSHDMSHVMTLGDVEQPGGSRVL